MPFLNFLFGGSIVGKIVLFLIGVLTLGAGYAILRAKWKAQGRAQVIDQLNKEGDARNKRMQDAPKVKDDEDLDRTLRDGRG